MQSRSFFRTSLVLIAILVFGEGSVAPQSKTESASKRLPNFHRINEHYYRGAQPKKGGLQDLAQMGVQTIVDLRGAGVRAANEQHEAERLGLRYVNIPASTWFAPTNEEVKGFFAVVDDPANWPVFVHCRRGAERTGVMTAIYRISHDGWSAEQAITEMKAVGFRSWHWGMSRYVKKYASSVTHAKPAQPEVPQKSPSPPASALRRNRNLLYDRRCARLPRCHGLVPWSFTVQLPTLGVRVF